MKPIVLVLLLTMFSFSVIAQKKGTIVGKITDKSLNNKPLAFANVLIKGTSKGTTTDFDGLFELNNLEVGTYVIVVSYLGYQTLEIPNVQVKANKVTQINGSVSQDSQSLEEVVITTTVSKESEVALLIEQKKAVVIKESIGAEQLSRQGVSDVASATSKISGIVKQEGNNKLFVRGLGDRYNYTTLNGLPLPSNDPSYKNIALELFSTDIIENIGVSKTASANLSGDFSGASINILSKELHKSKELSVSVSGGTNLRTIGRDFRTIDGTNRLGIARQVKHPVKNLNTYSFEDSFTPQSTTVFPNIGLSIHGGKKYGLGEEGVLSVFLVGSLDSSYTYRDGSSINVLQPNGTSQGSFTIGSKYPKAEEYTYNTNKLLLGNAVYRINDQHKISYSGLYIQANNQKIQDYLGTKPDIADSEGVEAHQILQIEDQNQLFVQQLKSENKFGASWDVTAAGAFNLVKNDQPNRKKTIFIIDSNENTVQLASGTSRNNSRYFHNLLETDWVGQASVIKHFGKRDAGKGKITLGVEGRYTKRAFGATYFDYKLPRPIPIDPNNLEAVFNQPALDNGDFRILTQFGSIADDLRPSTYDGEKFSNGVYTILDYPISSKFFANAGLRYEQNFMRIKWKTNLSSSDTKGQGKIDRNYLLFSLNLKYDLQENAALRLSYSKTYTYPQFKEIAQFAYEGIDYIEQGGDDLEPSENHNIDIKWEMFPKNKELISVAAFYKKIDKAITRVEINAASDRNFSYKNTGNANIFGLEAEYKKQLFQWHQEKTKVTKNMQLGINLTYMNTNQDFIVTNEFNPTDENAPLEGAAPFILNTDVSYKHKKEEKEYIASLVFHIQSDKVYTIGTVNSLQNIKQKGVPLLDFILKHQYNPQLGINFAVKNILDPNFERYRALPGNPITRFYQKGINISLGATYNF